MFSSRNEWLREISYALISDICQKEDHLLWMILDHWAMRMLAVGCQEQKMLMVGNPGKDGAGWFRAPKDFILQLRTTHDSKFMNYFWKFPFNIFRLQFTLGNHNSRKQTDKEDYCTLTPYLPSHGGLLHRMDISYFLFPKTSSGFQRLNSFLQSVQGDISI